MIRFRTTALRFLALAVSVLGCALGSSAHLQSTTGPRILRVGVDHTPPFYYVEPGKPVRGLAVDVLNEAARRSDLKLVWVSETTMPLNQALSKGAVDLWPLVAPSAERSAQFFISEPWLESDYVVVSLESHPVSKPQDAGNLPIAHAGLNITTQLARQYFPSGTLVPVATREKAVTRVCEQSAVAAVIETRVLDTMLLHRPSGCGNAAFRMVTIPGATRPLGLLAVRSKEPEARKLREEIGALEKNGFISAALDIWCPFTAEATRSLWARKAAIRDQRLSVVGMFLISILAIVLVLVLGRAVRLRKEAEQAQSNLRDSESRYRALFHLNPLAAWVYDVETLRFLAVNDAAASQYGWTEAQFFTTISLSDIEMPSEVGRRDGSPRICSQFTRDGLARKVEVTSYTLSYKGRPACLAIMRDLTSQEITLEQLSLSEQRWQLVLQGAGDGFWDWDMASGRVFRSQSCLDMLGYAANEVPPSPEGWTRLIHPDDLPAVLELLKQHLRRETGAFVCEYRALHKNGTWRWLLDRGQAVWDERATPLRIAGSHTDITARKDAEQKLNTEASTDALTGVANRREFNRTLEICLREARQTGHPLTLCISDLDHFKGINDTYGHHIGDHVLFSFASAAQDSLRKNDFVARTGGDEFVFLLPDTSADEALILAERIRRRVQAISFETPGGLPFRTSCSFGVATLGDEHGSGIELFEAADQSLYEAKKQGRNCVAV